MNSHLSRGQACPWRATQTLHGSPYQKAKETYRWKAEIVLCSYSTLLEPWIKPCRNICYIITQQQHHWCLNPWPDHGPGAQTDPQWYHSEENAAPEGRESKIQHLYSPKESMGSFRERIPQSTSRSNRNHTIPTCAGYGSRIQTSFTKWVAEFPLSKMEAGSTPQLLKPLVAQSCSIASLAIHH